MCVRKMFESLGQKHSSKFKVMPERKIRATFSTTFEKLLAFIFEKHLKKLSFLDILSDTNPNLHIGITYESFFFVNLFCIHSRMQ